MSEAYAPTNLDEWATQHIAHHRPSVVNPHCPYCPGPTHEAYVSGELFRPHGHPMNTKPHGQQPQ